MSGDVSDRLIQEVNDLLETSSVGLYEFIWIVRGMCPEARDDELRAWAAEALRRLLESNQGRLVLLKWPSEDVVDNGPSRELAPDDWNDPVAGESYMAVIRN